MNYKVIKNAEELNKAIEHLSRQPAIGLDTETTDLDPYTARLRLIQLATPEVVSIVDLNAFTNGDLSQNEAIGPLRRLLEAPRPIKIAHNAKFDAKFIKHKLGADLGGVFDTLLASQLLGAGDIEERHGLDTVATRYLNQSVDKSERLSNWNFELSEAQLEYAARDAAVLLPLREKLIERLRSDSLVKCAQLEFECIMPVADLELAGFFMHKDRWLEQLAIVEKRRAKLAYELQEVLAEESTQGSLFGTPVRAEINLDSHQQLTRALERLGIPVPDSTCNWKLQPLALEYPIIGTLLEYRTVQKALTSYGQNMIELINPVTGRLHADFRQIGAPTGRFSCTNPNIQQVPHAVEYRRCFSGNPTGRKLVIADYSQIELRILAEFSGDPGFIDAFNSGADLHRVTGTYRQLDNYLRDAANRAVRDRQARTASGRLVRFRFDEQDRQQISMTQRNGKNTPIQGTSADILKRALRLLRDQLRHSSANIVNIIHDEIVVETDADEAEETAQKVEGAMRTAGEEYLKTVPVKVETEIADEWVKE